MPNKSLKRKRSTPSPAFSISSVASNTSSINEFSKEILDNPNNLPIATNFKIMSKEIASFKPYKVRKVFNDLKKTGGKNNKRITIKKKKARKTLKKPMFKRNKSVK